MKKYALTSPQKELLALELYHDQSKLNTLRMTVMFKEDVDEIKFTEIMNQMIKENEVLRTKILRDNQQIFQMIKEYEYEVFESLNLSEPEDAYEKWFEERKSKTISIWDDKLYEIILFRNQDNQLGAQFVLHHLICDAWSIIMMTKKFVQYLHKEEVKNIQYDTFMEREASYRVSDKYLKDKDYWEEYIDAFGKNLESIFQKEVESKALNANRLSISLNETHLKKIESINQGTRKNTFDYLLTVTSMWIHNQWGLENFNIGLPVLNRINKKERQMLGLCISTVPMNFKVNEQSIFKDVHNRTHETWKKILRHQKYPLTEIKNIFNNHHKEERLFDILCSYQTSKIVEETKYMDLEWHATLSQTSPLMIHFDDKENKNILNVDFDYLESFISKKQMEEAITNWMNILEKTLAQPQSNLLSYENIKKVEYDKSIIDSLYDLAINNSKKIAVQSEQCKVDYGQLMLWVSEFSQEITECKEPLGIMMDRGTSMIVAMLSALSKKRPIVLIDPDLPSKRIQFIVEDLALKEIIIDKSYEILENCKGLHTIDLSPKKTLQYIDELMQYKHDKIIELLQVNKKTFVMNNDAWQHKNTLFIIYTSGTTGVPKGVAVTEGLIRNLAEYQQKYTSINLENVNVGQFSVVNFDPIYQEVFTTLLTGNTLIVIPEAIKLDPIAFLKYIEKHKINFVYLPTGYFKALMNNDISGYIPSSLNDLVVAGEQLKLNDNAKSIIKSHKLNIHNHYGPAEAHVVTTETISSYGTIPSIPTIGKAIKNHQMLILDQDYNRLDKNQTGELFIESHLLSRGYINRPDETKAKFIKSPFDSNKMMYKTGDLAYVNDENKIVFLGRADDQIKIRGKRVELGEIENTLSKRSYCKEATVINQVINDQNILQAYCIMNDDITYEDVEKDLLEYLPDYMMPEKIYLIDKMPLTFNGKVDKKKLKSVTYNQCLSKSDSKKEKSDFQLEHMDTLNDKKSAYVNKESEISAQGKEIAMKLIDKIETILSLRDIHLSDRFFALGGDSLKLIELNFFIQEAFGVGIPLSHLYESDGIFEIVQYIEKERFENKSDESKLQLKSISKDLNQSSVNNEVIEECYFKSTHVQTDIYFATQILENKTAYNMPALYKVNKRVSPEKIDEVMQKLVSEYDNLRANFFIREGEVVHKINPFDEKNALDLNFIELKDNALSSLFKHFVRPFDLEKDNLFRCQAIYDHHVTYFFFDWHHVIMDGISQSCFIKRFMNEVLGESEKSCFSNTNAGYIEANQQVILLENQCNSSQGTEKFFETYLEDYNQKSFVKILKNEKDAMILNEYGHEISSKKDAGMLNKAGHAFYQSHIDSSMLQHVKKFTKDHHISTFTLMSAVFMRTIEKMMHVDDLVISVPFSGRAHNNYKETLGMYVNTMPLRLKCKNNYDKTNIEFLKERQQDVIALIENQNYKSAKWKQFIKENDPFKDHVHSPMDILFAYQTIDIIEMINGISVEPMVFDFVAGKNPLTWMMFEYDDNITLHIEYDQSIFTETIIKAIEADMKRALNDILFSEKPLFNAYDDDVTIIEKPLEPVENIYDIIENNFKLYKNQVALKNNLEEMTYTQLEKKVETYSEHLKQFGVRSGMRVGIHCHRSMDLIIHLLSILKLGASYVPIDEALPTKRKTLMLKDADTLAYIDPLGEVTVCNKEAKPYPYSSEVYVIYTSGSTGKPKGISVSHNNVADLVLKDNFPHFNQNDKVLMSVSLSFDVSTFEIWGALLNGGCLCTPSKETILNTQELKSYLKNNLVNKMFMSTALFNKHIQNESSCFNTVEKLFVGGEALDYHSINIILDEPDRPKVYNSYGPTENTSFSTMYEIPNLQGDLTESISIGKGLIRRGALILDRDENILKPYQIGELAVYGEGVSNGYINNEDLTNQKFINHPKIKDGKVYLTGDLCWKDKSGNIHFIGRKDSQVKLRGIRIECDEIKNKAMDICDITQAVVMLDSKNEMIVMAYTGQESSKDVEKKLITELPKYMVPSVIRSLETLPVNKNGKVDKDGILKRLSEGKDLTQKPLNIEHLDEKKLSIIWEDVLGKPVINATDDFFKLGGHSLKATELINKVYHSFDVEMTINDVFEKSQFDKMVDLIVKKRVESKNNKGRIKELVDKLDINNDLSTYELSDAQGRVFAIHQLSKTDTSYNIPLVLELEGVVDLAKLEKSFRVMIQQHEILRTTYHIVDDKPRARIEGVEASESFKMEIFFEEPNNDLSSIFSQFVRPFDLSKDLMVRAGFIKGISNRQYLMIDVHHIAVDGYSAQQLYKVLFDYYYGKVIEVPKIAYREYAIFRNHQMEDLVKNHQSYWTNKLEGHTKNIMLPFANERGIDFESDAFNRTSQTITSTIDSQLKHKIDRYCKERNITLYMFYLGAFQLLVNKYTGEASFIIGSVHAGRNLPEVMDIIGMFVQTLPVLSVDFKNDYTVDEYYSKVKSQLMEDFIHVDYPFEKMVTDLKIQRQVNRNPLFDMMFIMQNFDRFNERLEDLNVHQVTMNNVDEKLDMTVEVIDNKESASVKISFLNALFEPYYIETFINHYVNLMNQIVQDAKGKIGDINVLTLKEASDIYKSYNQPVEKYNDDHFAQRIEDLFAEKDEKIALRDQDKALSYKTLGDLSKEIMLKILSISKKERIIAVLSDKTVMTYMGVVGIVRSGKAYMPIDMAFPKDRIEYIFENSQVKTIVGTKKNIDKFKVDMREHVEKYQFIILDEETKAVNKASVNKEIDEDILICHQHKILSDSTIDDPINVLYTSGTTGMPKGVVVTSRGIARMIEDSNFVKWGTEKNHMAVAPLVFDLSSYDLWATLLNKGTLNLVDKSTLLNPQRLLEFVDKNRIESAMFPTAIFNSIAVNYKEAIQSLSIIYVIGDVLSVKATSTLIEDNENVKIINAYGPTENAVVSTYYEVDNEKLKDNQYKAFPIGINLNGSESFVLDDSMNRVPRGVIGRLYVSGDGLAQGYLNNTLLTKEKFVQAPWDEDKVLYDTGDLVSLTASNVLNFHGRNDYQVKIRGNRIELGEIEKHMLNISYVNEATTIFNKEDEMLVGFVVVTSEEQAKIDDAVIIENIKLYLKSKLPAYGLPAYIEILEQLPMTINGKIDKKVLEKRCEQIKHSTTEKQEHQFVLPRNEMDKKLVEIWEKVIGYSPISIKDNYFEIGGDSIRAITLFSILSKEGIDFDIESLLKYSTVEAMSDYILSEGSEENRIYQKIANNKRKGMIPLRDEGQDLHAYVFPSYASKMGYYIQYKGMVDRITNCDFTLLTFVQEKDIIGFYTDMIAEDYINRRSERRDDRPYPLILLGYSLGGCLGAEVAHELRKKNIHVDDIIIIDSPFFDGNSKEEFLYPETRAAYMKFSIREEDIYDTIDEATQQVIIDDFVKETVSLETFVNTYRDLHPTCRMLMTTGSQLDFLAYNQGLMNELGVRVENEEVEGKEDLRNVWRQISVNEYVEYGCYGLHPEILQPQYIDVNSKVVQQALNDVYTKHFGAI